MKLANHCWLYCSSLFSDKKNDEQWLLAPIRLLQLYVSLFHCPTAMATTDHSPTTISSTFLAIEYLCSPSLYISLDWKPCQATWSSGSFHSFSVASMGHHWPFDSIIPPFSPLLFLSFLLFPSLSLFLLHSSSLHFYISMHRSNPVQYGRYRLISPANQNSLWCQFQKPRLKVYNSKNMITSTS